MSDFPIQPFFDYVLVKKDDASMDKDNIFHLPDTVKGRAQTGTVVAVGQGYLDLITGKFIPTIVKVGDRVWVKEFTGYRVDYKEHQVYLFTEKEIIGKIAE
jgi:co-chaperonin GroES (HSP10)